jgi:hypothetical protein
MRPTDNINELIKRLKLKASVDLDKRVHDDISMALAGSHEKEAAVIQPNIGRIIMRSPITKLAAAAVIIIACMIGLSLWRSTGSGIALADVLARVEQVESFRCKGRVTVNNPIAPDKPYKLEVRSIFLLSREHGCKVNVEIQDPNGTWLPYVEEYTSDEKKTCARIAHTGKKYIREEINPEWFKTPENQQEDTSDPGYLLKAIMACKYENLGRSIVDGVEVEGFRTTDPNCRSPVSGSWWSNPQVDIKLWVSVKTHLPVRFEDFSSSIDERGVTHTQRQVMYDVEWDVPVTAAEFYPPPVPDGYTVVDIPRVDSEETAIQGLKRCIDLFGNYLESISDDVGATGTIYFAFEKSETPEALQLKKEIKELEEKDKLKKIESAADPIYRLIWFYVGLVQDRKDPAYCGKTVTPKDADKVLLRWKLSDKEYRVIYGDLHAETVTPEKLAELEKP